MVNLPVFFTSAVASTEKSSSIFETSPFAMPLFVAKASQMAVFVRAEAAFFHGLHSLHGLHGLFLL